MSDLRQLSSKPVLRGGDRTRDLAILCSPACGRLGSAGRAIAIFAPLTCPVGTVVQVVTDARRSTTTKIDETFYPLYPFELRPRAV